MSSHKVVVQIATDALGRHCTVNSVQLSQLYNESCTAYEVCSKIVNNGQLCIVNSVAITAAYNSTQ